jgi:hypothetical protein
MTALADRSDKRPHSHWTESDDLVIEQKTLLRQVGWIDDRGFLEYIKPEHPRNYTPIFRQVAVWVEGEGWKD